VQQMAESPALLESGRQLGLSLVTGKCILMYAPPVRSFHKFHRTINMIFGKL